MDQLRTVALDLGGVLLTDATKSAFTKLAGLGIHPADAQAVWHDELRLPAELGHIESDVVFERLASLSSDADPREVEALVLADFTPIRYGVSFLERCAASGTRVALATNHLDDWLARWQEQFAWFRLLDPIVCSSTLGHRKPDATFFKALVEATGGNPHLVFVDDDPSNVAAACDAGLRGVTATGDWATAVAAQR